MATGRCEKLTLKTKISPQLKVKKNNQIIKEFPNTKSIEYEDYVENKTIKNASGISVHLSKTIK